MKFISKKNILLLFLFVLIFTITVLYAPFLCRSGENELICNTKEIVAFIPGTILGLIFVFLLLLLPVLTTLPFKNHVFKAWIASAKFTFPIVLLGSLYISDLPVGGSGFHPIPNLDSLIYSLCLYGSYFLVSFVIIGLAWYRSRKKI